MALMSEKEKKQLSLAFALECETAKTVGHHLLSGPEVCCMIEILSVLASCTKDFSLKSEALETFLFLTSPTSFKASLLQVNNQMSDAFQIAYNSMDKINENLKQLPFLMVTCLEALDHLDDPNILSIIKCAHQAIQFASDKCVAAAKDVDDQCIKALNFIKELSEKACAIQGKNKNRADEVEKEMENQKAIIELKKKELQEIVDLMEEQKEIVAEAREDHKEAMSRATNMDDIFSVMVLDCVNNFFQAFSKNATNIATSNLPGVTISAVKNSLSKKSWKKADILAQAKESVTYSVIKEIMQQNDDELLENIGSNKNKLKSAISNKGNGESWKILHNIANDLHSVFGAIEKDKNNSGQKISEVKERAEIALKMYETAFAPQEDDENEGAKKTTTEGSKSFFQTKMDTIKISHEIVMIERNIQTGLRKERVQAAEQLHEVIRSLENMETENVDLADVIFYLNKGIEQLGRVQTAWRNIITFFNHIRNKVDGSMAAHVGFLTSNMNDIVDNNVKEVSDFQRRKLVCEVTKACVTTVVLMQSTELYKMISIKHIDPILERARLNAGLPQKEARERQLQITSNFDAIKANVEDDIKKNEQIMPGNSIAILYDHGFNIIEAIEDVSHE